MAILHDKGNEGYEISLGSSQSFRGIGHIPTLDEVLKSNETLLSGKIIGYVLVKAYPGSPAVGFVKKDYGVEGESLAMYRQYPEFWKPIYERERIVIAVEPSGCDGTKSVVGYIVRDHNHPVQGPVLEVEGYKFTHRDFVQALHWRWKNDDLKEKCDWNIRPASFSVGCKIIRREEVERIGKLLER